MFSSHHTGSLWLILSSRALFSVVSEEWRFARDVAARRMSRVASKRAEEGGQMEGLKPRGTLPGMKVPGYQLDTSGTLALWPIVQMNWSQWQVAGGRTIGLMRWRRRVVVSK